MRYIRLSVNINEESAQALKRKPRRYFLKPWKRQPRLSITEKIRRAVALYYLFDREWEKGNTIRVVGPFDRNNPTPSRYQVINPL